MVARREVAKAIDAVADRIEKGLPSWIDKRNVCLDDFDSQDIEALKKLAKLVREGDERKAYNALVGLNHYVQDVLHSTKIFSWFEQERKKRIKLMAVDFDKKSIPCPMHDGIGAECVCGLYDLCENQPCRILARRKR